MGPPKGVPQLERLGWDKEPKEFEKAAERGSPSRGSGGRALKDLPQEGSRTGLKRGYLVGPEGEKSA